MADSTLTVVPPLAQAAAGHSRRGEPRPPFKPTGDLPVNRIPNAAATLSATLPDYVRFLIRAFDRSDWFVSTTKINTALSWGLGWGLEDHQGGQWCWHWGDNPGFKNIVLCQPAKRSGLLVFTNGDNGRALYERIARDVLGDGHAAFLWI
jgi:hypothetical protein